MATAVELLRQGRRDEVWRKYCGFLDLNIEGFMEIQERLLMEQVNLLSRCELGQKLLGGAVPRTMEEFRAQVPLTTYEDYSPYLATQTDAEGIFPSETYVWARTSGRSEENTCKWAPYSREMVTKVGEFAVGTFIMASCSGRGDVRLHVDDCCLYTLAPPPYYTGAVIARGLVQELNPRFMPTLEDGDRMEFEERIQEGFKIAMRDGIDLFYGLSSILLAIGEQFERGSSSMGFSLQMLHPALLYRVAKGFIRSKLRKRPMRPRDLWKIKGIIAGGMDTSFYRDRIEQLWGTRPLEGYGGTELGGVAIQAWNRKGMTFLPDCCFWEFIPEDDFYRSQEEPGFVPRTLRMDEVTPGVYELVATNFHGNVFTRYRSGDLIEIVSLNDPEIRVNIPQMVFHARADGVIDIAGFTRLTEKAVWEAIEEAGVPYRDWSIRKEYRDQGPILHLYLELKEACSDSDLRQRVHERLIEKDTGYADFRNLLGYHPLEVTILPEGSFARYTEERRRAGADMAHLKPRRMNPSDEVIARLLQGAPR
ncbi:MAG TPA: GH3 auxin-responsive promoter family protein [Chloroflexi bacterium]|nr:GH3 auxin-responsive promoter family protein [Chloroflexota bacterium]